MLQCLVTVSDTSYTIKGLFRLFYEEQLEVEALGVPKYLLRALETWTGPLSDCEEQKSRPWRPSRIIVGLFRRTLEE